MNTMILMCGPCGAGKTEFVERYFKKGWTIFSPDDYYKKINGDECNRDNSFYIWIEMYKDIYKSMKNGESVIIDTNAPTETMREQFLDWFPEFSKYYLIEITADYQTCRQNNEQRYRKIPEKVLKELYLKHISSYSDRSKYRWDRIFVFANIEGIYKLIFKGELHK